MYNHLKLRNIAEAKGVSNIELSGIVGKSRITVGNWMKGKTSPDVVDLEKMAKFFNVKTSFFFDDSVDYISKSKQGEFKSDAEIIRIQNALIESLQRENEMLRKFYDEHSDLKNGK